MRNFWKERSNKGLEAYLTKAVTDEARYCHAFKHIPQVRTALTQSNGPQSQAEMRLFNAAQMPEDSMRYKAEETVSVGNKNLRSGAATRRAESQNIQNQLFSRMEKIKPSRQKGQATAAAQDDTFQEMMIADSGVHNNDNLNDVDQLMEVDEGIAANDETDKENNSAIAQTINGNSQDLLDMVDKQGIVVTQKANGIPVKIQTGQEAYFALLAQDMFKIAERYNKDIQEVHKIFYEVSCNRENLIRVLKDEQNSGVAQWKTLEDLALRHSEDTPSF